MSEHIPDITKMVSDTLISDSAPHNVAELGMLYRKLERQLNEANDRIKRLENAGDAVEERLGCGCGCGGLCKACQSASDNWFKAKEAKL